MNRELYYFVLNKSTHCTWWTNHKHRNMKYTQITISNGIPYYRIDNIEPLDIVQVEVNGLICAGKKIHEVLLDADNAGVQDICRKYVQECQLMSRLCHPNITQFIGLCFLDNAQVPLLLMEKLEGSLDDLLETVPNIPMVLVRSLLEDVAKGLLYLHLHNPQIVHRDLTAKNVLLTLSLVAKITDFGNSRIVNLQPGQLARTLSCAPGTLVYMPPEALTSTSRYGPSLDIFSFGHLALYSLTQVCN